MIFIVSLSKFYRPWLYSRKIKLNGAIFYYPNKTYKGTIIFYHGLYSGYLNYLNVIEYFAKSNYKVVAFDFTGNMSSGGTSIVGMPNSEVDSDAIINFVIHDSRLNNLPIYIIGHSWGAHTALTALLHDDKHIKKVVALCPFNSNVDCTYSLSSVFKILSPFIYLFNLIKFGYMSTYKAVDAIKLTDAKALIYSAKNDTIVKTKYAYDKFIKYKSDNVDVKLIDSNHFLYMSDAAAKYFEKAVSWPRATPIDFRNLDYKLLDELNISLLDEIIDFLDK